MVNQPTEESVKQAVAALDKLKDLNNSLSLVLGLSLLLDVQRNVSALVPGAVNEANKDTGLVEPPTKDQIRTVYTALSVELAELIQELDWKPWKNKVPNTVNIANEFADILAFLGLLIFYLNSMGVSPYTLVKAYVEKTETNINRFQHKVEGY